MHTGSAQPLLGRLVAGTPGRLDVLMDHQQVVVVVV